MSALGFGDLATISAGLLVARLALGLLMVGHGAQKLFGWFGGYGLAGTGGFLESLGFRPGRAFAAAASLAEITGGVLVALGLLGPVGPALIISVMIVAAVTVHWPHGVFFTDNGIEVPVLYASGALALALTGYGAYSLDALLGLQALWTPAVVGVVIGIGIVGGIANLFARRPAASASRQPAAMA
jgi:putative oxidoreductase